MKETKGKIPFFPNAKEALNIEMLGALAYGKPSKQFNLDQLSSIIFEAFLECHSFPEHLVNLIISDTNCETQFKKNCSIEDVGLYYLDYNFYSDCMLKLLSCKPEFVTGIFTYERDEISIEDYKDMCICTGEYLIDDYMSKWVEELNV